MEKVKRRMTGLEMTRIMKVRNQAKNKKTRTSQMKKRKPHKMVCKFVSYINYKLVALMYVLMTTNLQSISQDVLNLYFCITTYNDYKRQSSYSTDIYIATTNLRIQFNFTYEGTFQVRIVGI